MCLGKNPFADPEIHARAMRTRSKNKAYCAQLSERQRGLRNTMHKPGAREKMRVSLCKGIAAGRLVPYNRGKAGKGKGPTESERKAAEVLSPLGFVAEHIVRTGLPKGNGNASWYQIDLAHLSRKIAVEIDGSSHSNRRETDARKDAFLLSKGWAVLRVPTKQIDRGLLWVQAKCSASKVSRRQVHSFTISK